MPRDIEEIVIRFIPQADMRYDTSGDWRFEGRKLVIEVARMSKQIFQQALAVHELGEALWCNWADITQEMVDGFDMGQGKDLDEPGFSENAPYRLQHAWADVLERIFIAAAGESWNQYDAEVGDHGLKNEA